MSPTSQCIACGSTHIATSDFLVSEEYPLLHCMYCGMSFLDVSSEGNTDIEFDDYWNDINERIYTHTNTIAELQNKYKFYFDRISDPVNGRLLDVGSGAGICVNAALQYGFDAMGVEPSEKGVLLSRKNYSINVVHDLLGTDDNLPHDYGVLTLWDVIEHVADPEELLSNCALHLSDKGFLVLETPDEGSIIRSFIRQISKISKSFDMRSNLYYRAHRYYFTQSAMEKLLRRCGFDEIHFYKERSMYEKALLKARYYRKIGRGKEFMLRILFWFLKKLPFLHNKMVVIARKSSGMQVHPQHGLPAGTAA